MIGKVFEIGYTLKKKMPILIRDSEHGDKEWVDIFYLNNHLFDLTMRGSNDDVRLSTLLIYSANIFETQKDINNIICKAFYPRKQIRNTKKIFIPVANIYAHRLAGCVGENWEKSSLKNF